MDQAKTDAPVDDSLDDSSGADERTLVGGEDHLATSRLPPLPRPPARSAASIAPQGVAPKPFAMPGAPHSAPSAALAMGPSGSGTAASDWGSAAHSLGSAPPGPVEASAAPPHVGSAQLSSVGAVTSPGLRALAGARPPHERRVRLSRWGAFVAAVALLGPEAAMPELDTRTLERRVATASGAFALAVVLLLVAVGIGLHGEPSFPETPVVAAALIVARALVSLGVIGFGLAVFRFAERIFFRS